MTADCASVRPLLGELALGGLGPDQEVGVRAHLEGCGECRFELDQLQSVARLLPLADPDRLGSPERVPLGVAQSLFARVAVERRRSRRRRIVAAAVAPVAVAAAVFGVALIADPDPSPGGREVALDAGPVEGRAELVERAWGTEVRLEVAGLPVGERHAVWLGLEDGSRVPAGTFTGGGSRELLVGLAAASDIDAATVLGIDDGQGSSVLRVPIGS